MTPSKITGWIKTHAAIVSSAWSNIRFTSLTGRIRAILGKSATASESSKDPALEGTAPPIRMDWFSRIRSVRIQVLQATGAIGLAAAITVGGNQFVKINTYEVYHVMVGGQEAGVVASPQVIDDYKLNKHRELQNRNPNVHMEFASEAITLKPEKAFKGKTDDAAVLAKLDTMLAPHAVGVQLTIDGQPMGVLKDRDTAEQMLNQLKSKYLKPKTNGTPEAGVLAAAPAAAVLGDSQLPQADFVQRVELKSVNVDDPSSIMDPQQLFQKLQTGDVKDTKYKVAKGDCLGCIAKRFGLTLPQVQQLNPGVDSRNLKEGLELNLTVLKPKLAVRTVERVVENQEVQYDTEVIKDPATRAGTADEVIQQGKNGMKVVTFEVTKINGEMNGEELVDEKVIVQPQKAVVKKGTKVVLGEGSGKFSWPVLSASLTSGFGVRWGKMHKGIDLAGNRNILASDNGIVESAGYRNDYGNFIVVDHRNGYKTLYGHLSQILTTVGKTVEKGEKIGIMGSTGDSTGVHLHFEVQRNDVPENPLKYLNR